ncbi:MAG TPA: RNA methyltransferase [Anaerolineales bacterium]|nr:RNA methyltransferase [Anaerolineales bacterium]HNN13622.1 RNA methyltransferase [Anaerolineales bacterium]HNO30538.1 RNA methyltransferase [Anaerolineales bacterium]
MITSNQNSKVKFVRALLGRSKERREAGAFVVEGVRLVEEALKGGWQFDLVLFDETLSERGKELLKKVSRERIDVEEVSTSVMNSVSETESPQGILAVVQYLHLPIPQSPNFILIPDQIRDPGNLGTLLRSAAATGVQAVLIPPETTDAFAPKVLRSGMGAHFRLSIHSMNWEEIEEFVKLTDLQVLIADMDGRSCWDMNLRQPLALVIGSEADGASEPAQRLASGKISIPMAGEVESLNAGVAGSVLMFEVIRQRGGK